MLLQFFFINMIIPITIASITTTMKIAPIIIAFAKVVSTEPTVFIAVVAIAVTSVPTTVEVAALSSLLSFYDYVITSLEIPEIWLNTAVAVYYSSMSPIVRFLALKISVYD